MAAAADEFDYDLLVIGGGSGGISAARRSSELGARVMLCDFVRPSPQGSAWGIGGTCVNVGCIPKKVMHTSALFGERLKNEAAPYGWGEIPAKANWETLRDNTMDYIHSLNFGYNVELRKKKVKYMNAMASFVDAHTCTLRPRDPDSPSQTVKARHIVIATGGRPNLPELPGIEHVITSDDLFMLPRDPGNTLIVGGSYVALECAGFLTGIGRSATVMYRSVPLRGFDQGMASRIVNYMQAHETKFMPRCIPKSIEKVADTGKLRIRYEDLDAKKESVAEYDTILFATGRAPELGNLNVKAVGLKLSEKTGKIIVDENENTSVPNIFAVGDVIEGGIELTPVAIAAGRFLAERLFANKKEKMNYANVPSTVFTPLEYGFVGYSEEAAEQKYGVIDVYHSTFKPLEWALPHLEDNACYVKMIVAPFDNNRVVGFHILAPNAGEIVQGVSVAITAGATKEHFDRTVGIHPTIAEAMTTLRITKASGENFEKTGC